eukprot:363517-Chlamydomonas_euryale.AAC.9
MSLTMCLAVRFTIYNRTKASTQVGCCTNARSRAGQRIRRVVWPCPSQSSQHSLWLGIVCCAALHGTAARSIRFAAAR